VRKGRGGAPDWLAVIQGHSDPNGDRLCHGVADAHPERTRLAFREVRRVEILYPASLIIVRSRQKLGLRAIPGPSRRALRTRQSKDKFVGRWSFFGHRPVQEIRCPAVGKRLMSQSISARAYPGKDRE
jgi:hypothetical protein